MAGLWEFPGGKVHEAESNADALKREMREELDTDVHVGDQLHEVVFPYADRTVHLHFYRCRLAGLPRPLLGQEMAWVARDQLGTLAFPDADRDLIALLSRSATT
jgi:mutator protein MutT